MSGRGERETAAHRYADAGWPVFACIPGEKAPITPHGLLDATTDHAQVEKWFRRNPDRNVAIATGAPGPDVLDVDNHGEAGNGFAAFNRLKREGLVGQPRAIVRTPSGGFHAYMAGTDQRNGKITGQHLDYRAQGGYVVAPPSTVGGRPYEVVSHQPSADTFDWSAAKRLLDPQPGRAREPQRDGDRPRDVGHLADWVAGQAPDGHNRNDALFWASCRAVEVGDTGTLEAIAKAARSTGLEQREIDRTIKSAQRGAERPFVQRQADAEAGA
jgi:hypothetical protein